MKPLFSVVIPAYNASSFIEETLQSVYNQTFRNIEIIVVNDGSTDDTLQVLQQQSDERLQIINKENGGVSSARNAGITAAKGEYLAFLDSDDLWAPYHLEYAAAFFKEHPEIMWWSSKSDVGASPRFSAVAPVKSSQIISYYGEPSIHLNSSTAILHTMSAKALHPLFPEDMNNAEDWVAWVNYAEKHPLIGFCSVEDVLYRTRADSATNVRPVDVYHDRIMAFPRYVAHVTVTSNHGLKRYTRYRVSQRWWLLFANLVPRGWSTELREQRSLMGTPLYLFVKSVATILFGACHLLCKMFHLIDIYFESRLRKSR